jgi:two-component system, sensor histidine kinase and response regulator
MSETSGKILVIEDAEPLRNDIMEMLSFEGFEVRGAENGISGVDVARDYRPDLIICDIMMPELDGWGVLDMLRQDDQMGNTPFIFLTARTDRTEVRMGMGKGADDYLTKPFVAAELLSTIHARLKNVQRHKEQIEKEVDKVTQNIITHLPHELRTPLNTIIGFSDLLIAESERIDGSQIIEWAQHINLAGQRLFRLVENYLTYVRAEVARHNPIELATIEQNRLQIPSAIIQFQATHKAQQAERELDLEMELCDDVEICMSDQDLSKIVQELVDNALKFSIEGQPVGVRSYLTDTHYVLEISDQGRGMTAEQIDSVGAYVQFERYFYEHQGNGLGLVIAKRLTGLYNGEFKIESSVGKGTTVTAMLLRS